MGGLVKRGPARKERRACKRVRADGMSPAHARRLLTLLQRDGALCWLCRESDVEIGALGPMRATLDHVLPVALGGENDMGNLRLAHARCNERRGTASPEAFRRVWGYS